MSTTRRVFPEVFKREAVDRVISSGLSVGKVATELGLNETVLRRWVMRLGGQATGPARRPITQAPVASPSDLAAENTRLRGNDERGQRLQTPVSMMKVGNNSSGSSSRIVWLRVQR
jgi:transposase